VPFIKLWVHLVWATKNREALLTVTARQKIFQHMKKNAADKNIYIDHINGHIDHVHCLVSLNQEQTIAKTVQLIKGESSHWINSNNLCNKKFEWQADYFAVSVSESGVSKVRDYIRNQEIHHEKKTFQQEYEEFIKKYGFKE
jgi:REP element-mobilizing transposase RayT